MKKWFFVVALLTMAVMALPAYANVYFCSGTVTSLEISSCCGGIVYVSGVGGLSTVALCTLNGANGNFNADSCKAAYATLLTAKLLGQNVQIAFSDSLSCTTQPGGTVSTSAWAVVAQ